MEGLDLLQVLNGIGIDYIKHEHPPVFTCEEAAIHLSYMDTGRCKNLFLRNYRGNQHYLVVLSASCQANLGFLSEYLGERKLMFASEKRLEKYLRVRPGSVSPFGLIYDQDKHVKVLIQDQILSHEKLSFHPNCNKASLEIASNDLIRFLDWTGHSWSKVNFD
ncbi:MAG: prolyl-tRNA synthetase associated domain-containing protein [Oligoflexales bacterium]|nr:prolyl-tRNA synthetase associated domain-containing protein [Oligoflexales bacterium]